MQPFHGVAYGTMRSFTDTDAWHILKRRQHMKIELHDRTADTVITYFRMARDPEIRRYLPQKAATEADALADYERTRQPGADSYGRTIYADGVHVGDIWCYCLQEDTPNAMLSYCIFDKTRWNQGIATAALQLFLTEIAEKFHLKSVGAFTFSANGASVHVLCKSGFDVMETLVEDGIESIYLQRTV